MLLVLPLDKLHTVGDVLDEVNIQFFTTINFSTLTSDTNHFFNVPKKDTDQLLI